MNSVISCSANKRRIQLWLSKAKNRRMILKKSVSTGMRHRVLCLMVSKIEQWEAPLVARTEYPSVSDWPYQILLLTIGAAMKVTRQGVVRRLNLL